MLVPQDAMKSIMRARITWGTTGRQLESDADLYCSLNAIMRYIRTHLSLDQLNYARINWNISV